MKPTDNWINEAETTLKEGKIIGFIWFLEEIEINVIPKENNGVKFIVLHATEGFENAEICSIEDAITNLKSKNKPDEMFVEPTKKEVKKQR